METVGSDPRPPAQNTHWPREAARQAAALPAGACDCHVHVFGPPERFPLAPQRPYTPGRATVEELTAHQRSLGLDRAVIVQPSPYGADNSCALEAIASLGGRARAVVALDDNAGQEDLQRMHAAGVRGLRVNLETNGILDPGLARRRLLAAAALAAPLGWHLQCFLRLALLGALEEVIRALPTPVVFDHFALAGAAAGPDNPQLRPLLSLLAEGKAYVKLSAPHRISGRADCADAAAIARTFIRTNPRQVLWGSDWPHAAKPAGVSFDRLAVSPFRAVDDGRALERLIDWAGERTTLRRILVDNPARLYGFA